MNGTSSKGVYLVFSECADPAQEADFNRWYTHTHLADVLRTAPFARAWRYRAGPGRVVDRCQRTGDRIDVAWPACEGWEPASLDCQECGACCRAVSRRLRQIVTRAPRHQACAPGHGCTARMTLWTRSAGACQSMRPSALRNLRAYAPCAAGCGR